MATAAGEETHWLEDNACSTGVCSLQNIGYIDASGYYRTYRQCFRSGAQRRNSYGGHGHSHSEISQLVKASKRVESLRRWWFLPKNCCTVEVALLSIVRPKGHCGVFLVRVQSGRLDHWQRMTNPIYTENRRWRSTNIVKAAELSPVELGVTLLWASTLQHLIQSQKYWSI